MDLFRGARGGYGSLEAVEIGFDIPGVSTGLLRTTVMDDAEKEL